LYDFKSQRRTDEFFDEGNEYISNIVCTFPTSSEKSNNKKQKTDHQKKKEKVKN
jgi:hypothetical protein